MSNRSDKKKEEQLRADSERLARESAADREAVRTRSPLDLEQEAQATGWFSFLKDPNRDFSKAPMPLAGVAEFGEAGAEADRTALGAMQFGKANADPNLSAVIAANMKERKQQRAGKALESAVGNYDLMMRGLADSVVARENARRMGLANMTTGAGANALNQYAQFQVRPHWGLSLASGALGAAGSIFAGRLGGGGGGAQIASGRLTSENDFRNFFTGSL